MEIQQEEEEDLSQNQQQQQHNPALSKGNLEDEIVRSFQHININSPILNDNENKHTTNNNNNTNSGRFIRRDRFKKLSSGKTTISRCHVTTHAHATTYLQQFQVNKSHDHNKKKKIVMSCPNCGRRFRTQKLYMSHFIRDQPEIYLRLVSLVHSMLGSSITTNKDRSSSSTVWGTNKKKDDDEERLCNAINDLMLK